MLQFRDDPAFVHHRARAARFLATDLVRAFLNELCWPLGQCEIEILRSGVGSLDSPLDLDGLVKAVEHFEEALSTVAREKFLIWATFIWDPAASPYKLWYSYDYAFARWASAFRRGDDRIGLGRSASEIYAKYQGYVSRKQPSDTRRAFRAKLTAQLTRLSPWDQLVYDLMNPACSEYPGLQLFSIVEHSFDMVQFQRFMVTLREYDQEVKRSVETFAAGFFHESNPGPFLEVDALPLCCSYE